MHSSTYDTKEGEFTVHHNGDWSGDVVVNIPVYHPHHIFPEKRIEFHDNTEQRERFRKLLHSPEDLMPDYYSVEIPFDLMKQIVADKLRSDYISRFEEMSSDEVLSWAFKERKL
jgi:hypothetical protein